MIETVKIDSIKLDKNQPRKQIDPKAVENLAKSLKTEGLIHSIELDENKTLIVGELRLRAAKLLGWTEIKANINSSKLSPYERLRRQMAENLQQSGAKGGGQPMNTIDTARAWARLYELKTGERYLAARYPQGKGVGGKGIPGPFLQIAEEVGISKDTVWEYLQYLEEPKNVIEALEGGLPRTYISEVNRAAPDIKEELKEKVISGEIIGKDKIRQIALMSKHMPELARIQMLAKEKSSEGTNRILTGVTRLALALEALPYEEIDIKEKGIVTKQLEWLTQKIQEYLK